MPSAGQGTRTATTSRNRDLHVKGLQKGGHAQSEIDRLLSRWVVTKHVYVAPTDAQAREEAREPEMWYRDSFIRSMSADGLAGLHESVYRGAEATIARLSAQTWENLLADALIIGSPEPVAGEIAHRQQ